jgi:hypothetical protein
MAATAAAEAQAAGAPGELKHRPPRPLLRPAECRALARADARYKKAKRALEEAEAERKALIAKARPKVKLGEWVTAGGWAIKITVQNSGERFSLKDFREAGYKVTAAMRKFVSEGSDSPRLTVESAE